MLEQTMAPVIAQQEQAQEEAVDQENSQRLAVYEAEGRPTYRDPASGLVTPSDSDATWQAKQAEKFQGEQNRLTKEQARAQQIERNANNERLWRSEARPHFTDARGDLVPEHDDKTWATVKAAKMAEQTAKAQQEIEAKRRAPLKQELDSLQLELQHNPERQALPTEQRRKLESTLKAQKQAARLALQQKLELQAKEVDTGNGFNPFDNKPTAAAKAAQERLNRLYDPNQDLADEDVADLESTAPPVYQALSGARDQLKADDERRTWREQNAKRLYDLKLKHDNPDAWEAQHLTKLGSLPEPEAEQTLKTLTEDFTKDNDELSQQLNELRGIDERFSGSLSDLRGANQRAKETGIPAERLVTLTNGETWDAEILAQAQAADTEHATWRNDATPREAALLAKSEALRARAQRLQSAADGLNARKAKAAQDQLTKLASTHPELAAGHAKLNGEAAVRMTYLEEQYPEGVPPEAIDALNTDLQQRAKALSQEQQARDAQGQQLYRTLKQINPTWDWSDGDAVGGLVVKKQAAALGLSLEQAKRVIAQQAAGDWSLGDTKAPTRVTPTGQLLVNPALIADEKQYKAAVDKATATPEAKQAALAALPDRQREYAQAALPVLTTMQDNPLAEQSLQGVLRKGTQPGNLPATLQAINGLLSGTASTFPSFNQFSEQMTQAMPGYAARSPSDKAADYLKLVQGRSWFSKLQDQISTNLMTGTVALGQQVAGVAGFLGSQSATNVAGTLGKFGQMEGQRLEMQGANSDPVLTTVGALAGAVPSLLPGIGAGKAAALAGNALAGTQVGQGLIRAAGLLTKAKTQTDGIQAATQMARAMFTQGTAVAGSAVGAGAQTLGSVFSDAVQAYQKQGMTPEAAMQAARAPAMLAAFGTAALTFLGGAKGAEALLKQEGAAAAKTAVATRFSTIFKGIVKEAGEEGLEEGFDQLWQGLVEKASFNPGKQINEILSEALQAAAVGGVLGGAVGGVQGATEPLAPPVQNRPETVALAQRAISNFALTDLAQVPAALQVVTAEGVPDMAATQVRAQDAAFALLDLAQGADIATLPSEELAAMGLERKGDKISPVKASGPDGAPAVPMVEIDGSGQAVITQPALDWLAQSLPEVRRAVGLDEQARREQLKASSLSATSPDKTAATSKPAQVAPDANTGGRPFSQAVQAGSAPTPAGVTSAGGASGPGGISVETAAPAALSAGGLSKETAGAPPAAAVSAPDNTTPEAQRATELERHLTTLGLPAATAKKTAAHLVKKLGVVGEHYTEQVVAPGFNAELKALGFSGSTSLRKAEENPLTAPKDLEARLLPAAERKGNVQQGAPAQANNGKASSVSAPQNVPQNVQSNVPGTNQLGTIFSRAARSVVMTREGTAKAQAGQTLNALGSALAKHHAAFDDILVGPEAQKRLQGRHAAVQVINGKVTLMLDLDQYVAQHAGISDPKAAATSTAREELWHALSLRLEAEGNPLFTMAQKLKQWRSLPAELKQQVWQSYHALAISTGKLSREMPATFTETEDYSMAEEYLRMLAQNETFQDAITETVDPAGSLLTWIRDVLAALGDKLKQWLKQASPDVRADLQMMVTALQQAEARFAKASTGKAAQVSNPHLPTAEQVLAAMAEQQPNAFGDAALNGLFDTLPQGVKTDLVTVAKAKAKAGTKFTKAALARRYLAEIATDETQQTALLVAAMGGPRPATMGMGSLNAMLSRVLTWLGDPVAAQTALSKMDARKVLRLRHRMEAAQALMASGVQVSRLTDAQVESQSVEVNKTVSPVVPDEDEQAWQQAIREVMPTINAQRLQAKLTERNTAMRWAALQQRAARMAMATEDLARSELGYALMKVELAMRERVGRRVALAKALARKRMVDASQKEMAEAVEAGRITPAQALYTARLLDIAGGIADRYARRRVQGIGTHLLATLNAVGIGSEGGNFYTADPNGDAYVERRRVILKQSVLDKLAEVLPASRALIGMDEAQARAFYGLPAGPAQPQTRADVDAQLDAERATLAGAEPAPEDTTPNAAPVARRENNPEPWPTREEFFANNPPDAIAPPTVPRDIPRATKPAAATPAPTTEDTALDDELGSAADRFLSRKPKRPALDKVLGQIPNASTGDTTRNNLLQTLLRSPLLMPTKAQRKGKGEWDWMETSPLFTESGLFGWRMRLFRVSSSAGRKGDLEERLTALESEGHMPDASGTLTGTDLSDALMAAIGQYEALLRGDPLTAKAVEDERMTELEAQTVRFEKDTETGPLGVDVASLEPGQVLILKDDAGEPHRLVVESLNITPLQDSEFEEGNPLHFWQNGKPVELTSVALQDGTTYGLQRVAGSATIFVDGIDSERAARGAYKNIVPTTLAEDSIPLAAAVRRATGKLDPTQREALKTYRDLTKRVQSGDRLQPAQAVALEDAERTLGQQFFFDIAEGFGERALEPWMRPQRYEQQALFAANRRVEQGFYSKLAETLDAKMPNRADAKTITGILGEYMVTKTTKQPDGKDKTTVLGRFTLSRKAEAETLANANDGQVSWQSSNGIKEEELKWSGLMTWLDGQVQPVAKQTVLDYLGNEGAVRFEEVRMTQSDDAGPDLAKIADELDSADGTFLDVFNDPGTTEEEAAVKFDKAVQKAAAAARNGDAKSALEWTEEASHIEHEFGDNPATSHILKMFESSQVEDATQYAQYQLPGGPLSRDTEILTRKGWKRIDLVEIGELALTRKDEGGELEWQPIEAKPSVYAESLYHFKNQSVDMQVTACHKMVVKRRRRSSAGVFRMTAAELWKASECLIPLRGTYAQKTVETLFGLDAGDVAEFFGWYIAEGSCVSKNGKKSTIGISQSRKANPKKCARLEALFERLGFSWNYVDSGPCYYIGIRSVPKAMTAEIHAIGKSADKEVPQWLMEASPDVLQRLSESLILGDGSVSNQAGRMTASIYFTKSKTLADQFQIISILLGKRACVRQRKSGLYTVRIGSKAWASVDDAKHAKVPYNDTAFCVTVENHAILVRRNGIAAFTGNSNYREVVLTMPVKSTLPDGFEVRQTKNGKWQVLGPGPLDENVYGSGNTREEAVIKFGSYGHNGAVYTSSHFRDVPNYVAHMRLNERADVEGKPGLFLEEVQSDRHQAGREKGYVGDAGLTLEAVKERGYTFRPNGRPGRLMMSDPSGNDLAWGYSEEQALANYNDAQAGIKIPDAPFRKDWSLAMVKRALRDAVASGKDFIAWTVGSVQAERYDISKQVKHVEWEPAPSGVYVSLPIRDTDQQYEFIADTAGVIQRVGLSGRGKEFIGNNLAEVIGKEITAKVLATPEGKLEGDDLRVGGKGMEGFYDNIWPKEVQKYVKQWGAKVERQANGLGIHLDAENNNLPYKANATDSPDNMPYWRVDITPAMRASVAEGQALFAAERSFTGGLSAQLAQASNVMGSDTREALPMDEAIVQIESFHGDPEDTDYWPKDMAEQWDADPLRRAVEEEGDFLQALPHLPDSLRNSSIIQQYAAASERYNALDKWVSAELERINALPKADFWALAGPSAQATYNEISSDDLTAFKRSVFINELKERLAKETALSESERNDFEAATELSDEAGEFLQSEEMEAVLQGRKKALIDKVKIRVNRAIAQIEATGRYTWDGNTGTFDEQDAPQVLYAAQRSLFDDADTLFMGGRDQLGFTDAQRPKPSVPRTPADMTDDELTAIMDDFRRQIAPLEAEQRELREKTKRAKQKFQSTPSEQRSNELARQINDLYRTTGAQPAQMEINKREAIERKARSAAAAEAKNAALARLLDSDELPHYPLADAALAYFEWWRGVPSQKAPGKWQQALMTAVDGILPENGFMYNRQLDAEVMKVMGNQFRPEDMNLRTQEVDGGQFGVEVISAKRAVESQRSKAAQQAAAASLNTARIYQNILLGGVKMKSVRLNPTPRPDGRMSFEAEDRKGNKYSGWVLPTEAAEWQAQMPTPVAEPTDPNQGTMLFASPRAMEGRDLFNTGLQLGLFNDDTTLFMGGREQLGFDSVVPTPAPAVVVPEEPKAQDLHAMGQQGERLPTDPAVPEVTAPSPTAVVVDEPALDEPPVQGQVTDFGEVIPFARKHTARPLGPKPKIENTLEDTDKDLPAWRRKYIAAEELRLVRTGMGYRPQDYTSTPTGKWIVARKDGSNVRSPVFDTEQAALEAIPLLEVARNHAVGQARKPAPDGSKTYAIYRKVGERKRPVVKGGFASYEEGMAYMVTHPAEIIEHKFAFPTRPWLDRLERTGGTARVGDVTPQMFQDTFAFRGGQFGNWNMGGDGQAALNGAYDALLDFADILGVQPKALSLNGELAIAFGARGHGGEGAGAAHYEPGFKVINLTKIRGAGSLAHEWFHAFDHYLGRQDGKGARRVARAVEQGRDADYVRDEYVSHGFGYQSGVREALREAFKTVISRMTSRKEARAVQVGEKQADMSVSNVKRHLDQLRQQFTTYHAYSRKKVPATAEQLAEWDRISEQIMALDVGEALHIPGQNRMSIGRSSFPRIEELNAIYKTVLGRSFATNQDGSLGKSLYWAIKHAGDVRARLAAASEGATEIKTVATDYFTEAKFIDEMRAEDYWSTPHEMGARSFESYISDKLAQHERRNDYLVHGADNRLYALMGLKPYPEGQERAELHQVWQAMFDIIQQETTDTGNVRLFAAPRRREKLTDPGAHPFANPRDARSFTSDYERQRDPASILQQLRLARSQDRATARQQGQPWNEQSRRDSSHGRLVAFARSTGQILEGSSAAALLSQPERVGGGGEHMVLLEQQTGRVWKFAKPGLYGMQAEDAESYLERWALANRVFADDVQFEGLVQFPGDNDFRAVISQPFYAAADPLNSEATMPQIQEYLTSKGFQWFPQQGYHVHPVTGLHVWDTQTPGNVLWTPNGAQPMDLQISPMRPEDLTQAREALQQGRPTVFAAPRNLDTAAHQAATSPLNARPEPTDAQKKAGNYALGHVKIGPLDLSIENPAGSVRRGTDAQGKAWETPMHLHYGYVKGSKSADGDHIDTFVVPGTPTDYDGPVWVVNQGKPETSSSKLQASRSLLFDEHKAVFGPGITGPREALAAYLANYTDGWDGAQSLGRFKSVADFHAWATEATQRRAPARGHLPSPLPVNPALAAAARKYVPEMKAMLAAASRVTESGDLFKLDNGQMQAYFDLPDVRIPSSKQPAARAAISAAAAVTGSSYERRSVVSAARGEPGRQQEVDAAREPALRAWRGLMDRDPAAIRSALDAGKGRISSLLEQFVNRQIPTFDIRGAVLDSPADFAAFNLAVRTPYFESLKIAVVDGANQVVHSQIVHIGALNESIAHPGSIAQVLAHAQLANPDVELAGWIIAHNHPSGDPNPSDADQRVTRRFADMGEILRLPLIDHVITNGERYFSFREGGFLSSKDSFNTDKAPQSTGLPALPIPPRPARGIIADWEVLPSGSDQRPVLNNPSVTAPYLTALRTADPDHYHLLYLNTKLALIAVERVDQSTGMNAREFASRAILGAGREGAMAVALSMPGADGPTDSQRRLVRTVNEALQSSMIQFADAMVATTNAHFSFREAGLLREESPALAAAPRAPSPEANPLARLGWNNIDRALTDKVAALTAKPRASAAEAVAAWASTEKVKPFADMARWAQGQLFPDSLLPREITAALREMQIRSALGGQKAMDLQRALLGTPKFSDLAYPPEFIENPIWRERLFDAMEGRADMAALPPAMQALGKRLRAMLVQHGREAVKAGRMSLETFEGLQENFMPRFTRDEAEAASGDFIKKFKLGVKDILQQRSTAWHIVDTTQKDPRTGEYVTVSHDDRGRKWRFRDEAQRNAFYQDYTKREAVRMLKEQGRQVTDLLAALDTQQKREVRAEIARMTADQVDRPAELSPALAGIVKRALAIQRQRYERRDPFDPPALIRDPVYAIARYMAQAAHDNATAEFFNFVDKNPTWVRDTAATGYVFIPDNPRFGRLAGKHVQTDIANQITEMVEAPDTALKIYDTLMGWWKTGKTVLNPGTHVRNVLGNLFFSQLAGNSPWNPGNVGYYKEAIAALRAGGPALIEAYEQGVLGADFVTAELRQTLRQLLPEPASVMSDKPELLLGIGKAAGKLIPQWMRSPTRSAYNQIAAAYQVEDEVFKLAAYLKAKGMGMDNKAAAEHVRKWFPYFDKGTSTTLKLVGRTAMPFMGFYRESARIFSHALQERPLSLATGLTIPSLITYISALMLGLNDEDREEVMTDMRGKGGKLLGPTPLGKVPLFAMLLPIRTEDGDLQQIDLSAIHPFTDFLGTRVESRGGDWWEDTIRSMVTAGPLASLAYAQMTGRDAFGDRTFVEADMTGGEKAAARLDNAGATLLPPLTPIVGTGYKTIVNAGQRSTNKTLEVRNLPQAITRAIGGVDLRNANPDLYRLAEDFRKEHGMDTDPSRDYGTTAISRARAQVFAEIAQDAPDREKLRRALAFLRTQGVPIDTQQDINRLLFYKDPLKVIGGDKAKGISATDAQQMFQGSLSPEGRRVLVEAVREFSRIQQRAPAAIASARSGGN
jgi:DNA repair protein RadC